jgi:hypothetical protein
MPVRRVLQSRAFAAGMLVALWGVVIAACAAAAIRDPGPELRHPAVTGSAAATVAWMLLGWAAMILAHNEFARVAWSLGWLTLLVHMTLAFGVAHGWSHAAAVEHVRQVGGYGEGILVNYMVAAVWGADVAWWWANPAGRARRPRWVSWLVHGFLAFVVVNATVVFGPAERRVWYVAALGVLAVLAVLRQRH